MLVPKTEHATRFLLRRAYRRRRRPAICCWAVMPEEIAQQVNRAMKLRRFREAFAILNDHSFHLGTLYPDDDVDAAPLRHSNK